MAGDSPPRIHPSAIVAEGAKIGDGSEIGPFSLVGPEVTIGKGVTIKSHAVVTGWTEIGDGTIVFPFACVGEIPQDLKYRGERTRLVIGRRNRIREGATLNTGTDLGGGVTTVGDDCLFMTGSHVGHDCTVGSGVIMANQAALGGHCVIEDNVIVGGLSGIHQHVRVGKGAIIGAVTVVRRDIIPFALVQGPAADVEGLNLIGLRRRGVSGDDIAELRKAYDELCVPEGSFRERAQALDRQGELNPLVEDVVRFILSGSDRSYHLPRARRLSDDGS